MCGIFGGIGCDCVVKTLRSLHFLEYRGYDSAGICANNGKLQVIKTVGRVSVLESHLPQGFCGVSAIGHTRWATHGAVCDQNAHPFLSTDGNFAICHNGIVENHDTLRRQLTEQGYNFTSQTDSEVIAHLLQQNYDGNLLQAVFQTANALQGAFAVVIQTLHGDSLYAIKNKSPLAVEISDDGTYLCSDVRCLSQWTKQVAVVPDQTVVVADKNNLSFYRFDGTPQKINFFPVESRQLDDLADGDKMLSEIMEIPTRVMQAKQGYFNTGGLSLSKSFVKKLSRIYFLGCGTAYNSGLEVCAVARNYLGVDLIPVVASEFIYDNYPIDCNTLAFCISQSGETADTIRAAEKVVSLGGFAYAVTNTDVSSLCFVCNRVKNVCAGAEFAVASTKAYNCQLVTLLLATFDVAYLRGEMSADTRQSLLLALDKLPAALDEILSQKGQIEKIADAVRHSSAVFFVGRTLDYPTATEGSLKLKEISYLHSEAYPSGELKHGTLALMERGVTVVVLSAVDTLVEKNNSTCSEIVSRDATVVTVSPFGGNGMHVNLPVVHRYFYGIVSVVPLQLLAYYVAKGLGRDVDKPRNLAKSVTVE